MFIDANRTVAEENRDVAEGTVERRLAGRFGSGDTLTVGGKRMQVMGYRSEDDSSTLVLADASQLDPDDVKRAAYEAGVQAMTDAWKRKRREEDEEENEEETKSKKKKKKPEDREFEMAGPLSDQQSTDADTIKRTAYEQYCAELRDAWQTRR